MMKVLRLRAKDLITEAKMGEALQQRYYFVRMPKRGNTQCNCSAQEWHVRAGCHCGFKGPMWQPRGSTEAGTTATPRSAPSSPISLKFTMNQAQESW